MPGIIKGVKPAEWGAWATYLRRLAGTATVSAENLREFVENTDGWQGLADVEDLDVWILRNWKGLERDIRSMAASKDGRLVLHRCIAVDSIPSFVDTLPDEPVGVHWAYALEGAQCHYGHVGEPVIVTALVGLDAIDYEGTLEASFEPGMEQEREVRLLEGKPIKVISIQHLNGKPIRKFKKPVGATV